MAIALILLVQCDPRICDVATTVTTVGLAALAVNQLVGCNCTRLAIERAREDHQDLPQLLDFLDEHHIS